MSPATPAGRICRYRALSGTSPAVKNADAQAKNVHELVPPSHVLDGFGSFITPPATARPVPADYSGSASAEHPPGFYGPPESLLAVNTLAATDRLTPLDFSLLVTASHDVYRT